MLEALKSLSEFFTENNLRSRRNLRGDIEKRSLAINEDFVRSFRTVKEVSVYAYVDTAIELPQFGVLLCFTVFTNCFAANRFYI